MSKSTGIESGLFLSFEGWDGDQESMQFYGAVLAQDIGPYREHQRVDTVSLNYRDSKVEFWNDDGQIIYEQGIRLVLV